jgi:hypothetical protein
VRTGDALLVRGLRLEYATLGWNVLGSIMLIAAALAARSVTVARRLYSHYRSAAVAEVELGDCGPPRPPGQAAIPAVAERDEHGGRLAGWANNGQVHGILPTASASHERADDLGLLRRQCSTTCGR